MLSGVLSLVGATAYAQAPPNDECASALSLTCGQEVMGDTSDATSDDVGFCRGPATAPGVWYTFVGDGSRVTLSTCGTASYDTRISVFSGSCGALTCVNGNDDFPGCPDYSSSLDVSTEIGVQYYILVHGWGQEVGDFELSISCAPPLSDAVSSQCSTESSPAPSDCSVVPPNVWVERHGRRIVVEAAMSPDAADGLQWAADCVHHGVVELGPGEHDFGENDSVELRNSLTLTGLGQATIVGGRAPLCINAPGEDVTITDLRLDGASYASVAGWSGGTIAITDLVVTGTTGSYIPRANGTYSTVALGIFLGESTVWQADSPRYGNSITIADNRIELQSQSGFFLSGINLTDFDRSDTRILIDNNEVIVTRGSGGFVSTGMDLAGLLTSTTTASGNVFCVADGTPEPNQFPLFLGVTGRSHQVAMANIEYSDNAIYGGDVGLYVSGRTEGGLDFSELRIEGSAVGIQLLGGTHDHMFDDITIRDAETGVELNGASFNSFHDFRMEVTDEGIYEDGSSGGNTFDDVTTIYVDPPPGPVDCPLLPDSGE